jgi:hypothetical protein
MENAISLPPLPSLAVTGTTVLILFALVVALWMIATLVLEYHWKNYAVGEHQVASVRLLYRAGSFFLLVIIFLSVLSFYLS